MSQFIEMFGTVESYCKLEDLVSDTFPGEWGSEPTSENVIKVIRTTNFTNEGHLDLADVVTRDIEPKKVARKKLKQGDTILERSGGTKDNPVGRVVFFDEIGDYLLNNFTQALRPKESVNPVYLFYALYNSYNINKAAMRAMASQTTGIQNLSMSDFMSKSIVLPSRDEQNKFEQIYRQADKSKFGDFKSQFIEMFGDSSVVRLEDKIATQSGGTPNTKKLKYYEGGNIPWLSSSEVNQGYIFSTAKLITQEGLDNSSARWIPKDSVLIAMYGATAGRVGLSTIPLTTNQAVCALLPCSSFNPIFLYYAVCQKTPWMISQCRGAAQPNISQGIIRSMELPIPPMTKQMQFVSIAKQADKSKSVIQKALVYLNDIQSDELGKIA